MSISAAIDQLSTFLGDRVSTSTAVRDMHGQNETYYPNTPPDAVVFPEGSVRILYAHPLVFLAWSG